MTSKKSFYKLDLIRNKISVRLQEVRSACSWTQADLAEKLGLSQSYLSAIEQGKGSLSAEQLLAFLALTNTPIEEFFPTNAATDLQNALIRAGALHLLSGTDALPSNRLCNLYSLITEVLLNPVLEAQLSALAPVLVYNIEAINLDLLYLRFQELQRGQRLLWLMDNVVTVLPKVPISSFPPWRLRTNRSYGILGSFLERLSSQVPVGEDILNPSIRWKSHIKRQRESSSTISQKWKIVSSTHPKDFQYALEAAQKHAILPHQSPK